MNEPTFDYSPSCYHQSLLARTTPQGNYQGGDFPLWQQTMRQHLSDLLGFNPPDHPPQIIQSLWVRDYPFGQVTKLVLNSDVGCDIPMYACTPHRQPPPWPWMICLQGHTTGMHLSIGVSSEDESLPLDVEGDRDFAVSCLQNGVAALCVEQRGFGQRREQQLDGRDNQGCHSAAMHALLLGKTLIAERVEDVLAAVRYLESRPDVVTSQIGVMGNSSGGTTSMFAAALLPQLAVAMPSCCFCPFTDCLLSIHHCVCNYVPRLYTTIDMPDLMGLIAPRPVVVVAGRDDPIFPIDGVYRGFERLRYLYDQCQAGDCCRLVVGEQGHRFYAQQAWQEMRQFIFGNSAAMQ